MSKIASRPDLVNWEKTKAIGLFRDYRDFIARGNVVDLAVGVVMGAAFGKVVTSIVDQVIMPPIGLLTGGVDFSQLKWVIRAANPALKRAEVAISYGAFINTLIQFLIIAWVVLFLVKGANALRRREAARTDAAPAAPTPTERLLTEIRDLLQAEASPSPAEPRPGA